MPESCRPDLQSPVSRKDARDPVALDQFRNARSLHGARSAKDRPSPDRRGGLQTPAADPFHAAPCSPREFHACRPCPDNKEPVVEPRQVHAPSRTSECSACPAGGVTPGSLQKASPLLPPAPQAFSIAAAWRQSCRCKLPRTLLPQA